MAVETLVTKDITILDLDHPGAHDPAYRRRRDHLASLAIHHRRNGLEPPQVEYTAEENQVWRTVSEKLAEVHQQHASRVYLDAKRRLDIPHDAIPQLRDLSSRLQSLQNFRLAAIEGLVEPKIFLGALADRVMMCTQYIRHASKPEYTPEPDVVHEVIGHVPMFADPDFAELSVLIGLAAKQATPEQIVFLDRLYWFTLEFGLIEEANGVRAYGAGLLSSFGELQHAFTSKVQHRPFDIDVVVGTAYNYSEMQNLLFVIPSFEFLKLEIERLIECPAYRAGSLDEQVHRA